VVAACSYNSQSASAGNQSLGVEQMTDTAVVFRVHFTDGVKHDVLAQNPDQARKLAVKRHDGLVSKIKRVK
jgi:hypothetical protein